MVKQVIVVRKDLNMRKGKMCAQVAHASLMSFMSQGISKSTRYTRKINISFGVGSHWNEWLESGQTKVVVGCDSHDELIALHYEADAAGLPTTIVTDAGRTEFHGEPTDTCVAIGPAEAEDIDRITGYLKLL
jgi:PTH2 family peptidyl-tRNA hydrolase